MQRYMKMNPTRTAIPCALMAMWLASLNAVAAPDQAVLDQAGNEFVEHRIKFQQLDLTRNDGVALLYARIRSAAAEVCAPPDVEELRSAVLVRRCREEAIAHAVADVNVAALTNYHLKRVNQAFAMNQR